jgi:hypothetical protein
MRKEIFEYELNHKNGQNFIFLKKRRNLNTTQILQKLKIS